MSWYFQLPENAKQHNDIAYWESDQSYQQTMAFYVDPDGAGTKVGFRTNRPSGKEHWSAPLSVGQWHQIAMQIAWSTDPSKGNVSVWLDGTEVVSAVPAATKADANKLFLQVGYHRDASAPDVESIFIDSALEATTLEEVLAMPKPPSGTGGAPAIGGSVNRGGQNGLVAPPQMPAAGGAAKVAPQPVPGEDVAPAPSGTAAGVPTTSSGGTAPTAGLPAPPPSDSKDDGGCDCSVPKQRPAAPRAWFGLGLLGLGLGRFGSRRAAYRA